MASSEGTLVDLQLACRGLIQMDWLSKSDPVVAVYEQGVGSDDWSYVGETEILKNNHEPEFKTVVTVFQPTGAPGKTVRLAVHDVDDPSAAVTPKTLMGTAECSMGSLVEAASRASSLKLMLSNIGSSLLDKKLRKEGSCIIVTPKASKGQAPAVAPRGKAGGLVGQGPAGGNEASFSWFPAKARKQLWERMSRYAESSGSEFSVVLKYPDDPQCYHFQSPGMKETAAQRPKDATRFQKAAQKLLVNSEKRANKAAGGADAHWADCDAEVAAAKARIAALKAQLAEAKRRGAVPRGASTGGRRGDPMSI